MLAPWDIRSEKGTLRGIYWPHSACRREAEKVESESIHVFQTLVPFILFAKEKPVFPVLIPIRQRIALCFHALYGGIVRWMKPRSTSLLFGTIADLAKGKSELLVENALLRQQLIILSLCSRRPCFGFHRELYRLFWKHTSKADARQPKISPETIALIKEMSSKNRLWGAERIRGELLKLGIRVCKRTIQKYMRHVHLPRPRGQKWATFLHNHAADMWACDFLQVKRQSISFAIMMASLGPVSLVLQQPAASRY